MQNRLASIFHPDDHRTVMLAIDHGYFQGPTSGLEWIDQDIVPLIQHADAIMLTRGVLRSVIPSTIRAGVVLRASGGPSILNDDLSNEIIAIDGPRLPVLVSTHWPYRFSSVEHETQTVANLTRVVNLGNRIGIPVVAVTAIGRELTRDARYLRLATRIGAELGAHVVKTYYCVEDFDTVTSACPVPIVMAGGKKIPELDALRMAHRAVSEGAAGVDMGRNIFQRAAPAAMIRSVRAVVHGGSTPEDAYEEFLGAPLALVGS